MVRLRKHDRSRVRNHLMRCRQPRLLPMIVPLAVVVAVMGTLCDPNLAQHAAKSVATTPTAKQPAPPRPSTAPGIGLFPGLKVDCLTTIRENSEFYESEKDAWFRYFKALDRLSIKDLDAARHLEANYIRLVDQPDFYRGKLISLYGYVQQVTEQPAMPNDLGIKRYYRIAIQPTDGSDWPIFIYCLALPPDLEVGASAGGYLSTRGLFFKKRPYHWKEGSGIAPVVVAKCFDYTASVPCAPGIQNIHLPSAAPDEWKSTEPNSSSDMSSSTATSSSFRNILKRSGWDVERLAKFENGQLLADVQAVAVLELLRQLGTFSAANLDDWVHDDLGMYDMLMQPNDYRGQLVQISGHVTKVTKRTPDAGLARRLEMPHYFECTIELDNQCGRSTILTTRIPNQWLGMGKLNEPASAAALYVKRLADVESPPAIWLAKEIAPHRAADLFRVPEPTARQTR